MDELTTLFHSARAGDADAVGRLYQVLYDDLRRIAHAKLRNAEGVVLLDTTGLVHESYLRLQKLAELNVSDRPHFLAYAARAMRSIVVDFARQQGAGRRGGDHLHVTLGTTAAGSVATAGGDEILRVHEALEKLGRIDPRLVQVVEMRYFAGLDEAEIADALGVSVRTVARDWEKARLFLFEALK